MNQDQDLIKAIKLHFGEDIYTPDGKLNREKMAGQVFGQEEKLNTLNSLVHPAVFREFDQWSTRLEKESPGRIPFCIKEAAILFESKSHVQNDFNVLVSAPYAIRMERVKARDGLSEEKIQERMRNQMPEEEKEKLADFILYNDDKHSLIEQALYLYSIWFPSKQIPEKEV